MYVIDDKVFYHMVKTSGTSFRHACVEANKKTDFNMRHLDYKMLPERYSHLDSFIILREPHSWYKSFYNFFINQQGYFSFMIHDPYKITGKTKYPHDIEFIDPQKATLKPIGLNEFARRSINFKDTLIKYPNKARVFNNILRTQGHAHFITTYFKCAIDKEKPSTYNQFDMSLFEWFWLHSGGEVADTIAPMNDLSILEDAFKIKIPHVNKTQSVSNEDFDEETLALIKTTHSKFYDLYEKSQKH